MDQTLSDIRAANKAGSNYAGQFVVYDLPDRDCAAAASNGEYSIANGGVANYKKYIDAIRAIVVKYSDIRILLVIGTCPPRLYRQCMKLTSSQSLTPSPTW